MTTNREYLIAALTDELDDWGEEEAVIYYHINCPYGDGDKRCHCNNAEISRKTCSACKTEWLDLEVDE